MNDQATWLDDDQQELWQALLTIVIGLPTILDRQLQRNSGISNFEYGVLARLSMSDNKSMRLSDLARACDSTQPRLSKLMDRFETRDWAVRHPDPEDGRNTLATLTEGGQKKLAESAPDHVAQVKQLIFEPLSPAQRGQLKEALTRIAASVREELD